MAVVMTFTRAGARTVWIGPVVFAIVLGLGSCRTAPEEVADPRVVEIAPDIGLPRLGIETSIEVDLPEPFIKLVDLGRLRVGMTKEEVLAIFPDPVEIRLRAGDELWQYGFAELIFRGNRLKDWFDIK